MKNMEIDGTIKTMEKSDDGWWTFEHSIAGKSRMKQTLSHGFGILGLIYQRLLSTDQVKFMFMIRRIRKSASQ